MFFRRCTGKIQRRYCVCEKYGDRKKYPIGIKLKGNAWVEKTGWYPDTCVVGLAAGLKNKDLAVKFIEENILED